MLKEKFLEVENRLLNEAQSIYRGRLVSLIVFGSVARETYRPDSDLDFLLIVEGLPRGRLRRMAEFMTLEERMEPFLQTLARQGINTYLSPVLKTPEEAAAGSPLFLDMVEDARILFDRDGFFSLLLERLRSRLQELGARRVWKGETWYWILKPDYQPGEEFDI